LTGWLSLFDCLRKGLGFSWARRDLGGLSW